MDKLQRLMQFDTKEVRLTDNDRKLQRKAKWSRKKGRKRSIGG
jgi:uncharacterized protein YhbP (UPF0306 family)